MVHQARKPHKAGNSKVKKPLFYYAGHVISLLPRYSQPFAFVKNKTTKKNMSIVTT